MYDKVLSLSMRGIGYSVSGLGWDHTLNRHTNVHIIEIIGVKTLSRESSGKICVCIILLYVGHEPSGGWGLPHNAMIVLFHIF